MKSGDLSMANVPPESSAASKGKAPLLPVTAAPTRTGGWKKGVAIFDFIIRLCAMVAALAAAAAMGTSDQTLPFFTQFFQFQASYDDLPTLQYALLVACSSCVKL
ncbi:hypothetical protein SAY86_016729 [Trapa natans]|uniref:CASP-like protein n=1 Tax=Trapa natans TaxID=22666 RepID=A0AAN7R5U2_TRANT|nr:hypothetical protein SAY86_016729 [Trapa natans]